MRNQNEKNIYIYNSSVCSNDHILYKWNRTVPYSYTYSYSYSYSYMHLLSPPTYTQDYLLSASKAGMLTAKLWNHLK